MNHIVEVLPIIGLTVKEATHYSPDNQDEVVVIKFTNGVTLTLIGQHYNDRTAGISRALEMETES